MSAINGDWYTAWRSRQPISRMSQVDKLLRGVENIVDADADYTGLERRPEHEDRVVIWQIAARRSTYKKLDKRSVFISQAQDRKRPRYKHASVEHPFRMVRVQFGFQGLAKNTS